ncbi:methionyl-tRNA formyltransferase, partial [Streptococcus danieliae]|nr:methionyl-tRNA formyltransferase [Streptococcus danieliae]
MNKKKIVFMGTPIFAVPILEMLIKDFNVELVITQPDKRIGRKKVLTSPPVKVV